MLPALTLMAALALAPQATNAGTPAAVPTIEQVMAVPAPLRAEVHARVVEPGCTRNEQLERLAHYVFGDDGLALEYDNEVTRTVAQVYQDRKANCLSFTLLFVALAREAGLDRTVAA